MPVMFMSASLEDIYLEDYLGGFAIVPPPPTLEPLELAATLYLLSCLGIYGADLSLSK